MAREKEDRRPDDEARAADYVELCERILNCCESATLAPVKQGVQK